MEQIEKVLNAIRELAPQVLAIYCRQAIVEGWRCVGEALFCLILAVSFGWGFRYARSHEHENSDWIMGAVFFFAISLGALIVSVLALGAGLIRIINPEYYAIQLFLEQF